MPSQLASLLWRISTSSSTRTPLSIDKSTSSSSSSRTHQPPCPQSPVSSSSSASSPSSTRMSSSSHLHLTPVQTNNPHSAYSAHEFSTLTFKTHHTASLPLDIKLETIVSVCLACFGLVLGSEQLKPVSWSAWAGQIEKKGGKEGNPFRGLEERVGFMDIRKERREFGEWARSNGGGKSG
jgi:membrane magnesium transporter 1